MSYTNGFKTLQIHRMAGPEGITANALAQENGVSQTTFSRWVREGQSVGRMADQKNKSTKGGARTGEDMLRILTAASQLSVEALGVFFRKEGIHEATLRQWQEAASAPLASASQPRRSRKSPEAKKVTELKKELQQNEKALAELTPLTTLQDNVVSANRKRRTLSIRSGGASLSSSVTSASGFSSDCHCRIPS